MLYLVAISNLCINMHRHIRGLHRPGPGLNPLPEPANDSCNGPSWQMRGDFSNGLGWQKRNEFPTTWPGYKKRKMIIIAHQSRSTKERQSFQTGR